MGEIAHRVAKRANAFGMNVVGYDPFITPYEHIISETGVKRVSAFEDLITMSDFISIHVPLTKETENIFNLEAFSKMKESAYIINTARGGIVNEADLCKAVDFKEIAGAYLDVLETEPVQPDSLLLNIDSIHLTPHIAGLDRGITAENFFTCSGGSIEYLKRKAITLQRMIHPFKMRVIFTKFK